jgi:hypothetical protein
MGVLIITKKKRYFRYYFLFSIGKTIELIIIRCNIRVTTIEKKEKSEQKTEKKNFLVILAVGN